MAAPREPRFVVASADGRFLAASSSRSAQVRLWDLESRKLLWERAVEDAFNLRGLAFAPDGEGLIVAHAVRGGHSPCRKWNIEEGWVIDSRLTRLRRCKPTPGRALDQIALDTKGRAVGDPHGLAFCDRGRSLAAHRLRDARVAAVRRRGAAVERAAIRATSSTPRWPKTTARCAASRSAAGRWVPP